MEESWPSRGEALPVRFDSLLDGVFCGGAFGAEGAAVAAVETEEHVAVATGRQEIAETGRICGLQRGTEHAVVPVGRNLVWGYNGGTTSETTRLQLQAR